MVRHDQVRVAGDPQRRRVDALGLEHVDLGEEHRRVDDDPVADHRRDVGVEDAARHELEREGLAVDDDRVAGVVPALVADAERALLGEVVGETALALVTPLGTDDHRARHGPLPTTSGPAEAGPRRRDTSHVGRSVLGPTCGLEPPLWRASGRGTGTLRRRFVRVRSGGTTRRRPERCRARGRRDRGARRTRVPRRQPDGHRAGRRALVRHAPEGGRDLLPRLLRPPRAVGGAPARRHDPLRAAVAPRPRPAGRGRRSRGCSAASWRSCGGGRRSARPSSSPSTSPTRPASRRSASRSRLRW